MGLSIMSHLLFQGILVELNIKLFLDISLCTFGNGYGI